MMFKKMFKREQSLYIYAPMNGSIFSLDDVPDPVFNKKMMGEGIAIQPTDGKVLAPVNGKIVQIAPTKHAIGITTTNGFEILIHVGLETVSLQGKGFIAEVDIGDTVTVGQPLMDVDLDYIQQYAKSTITPVVITNGMHRHDQYEYTTEKEGVAGKTKIITVIVS